MAENFPIGADLAASEQRQKASARMPRRMLRVRESAKASNQLGNSVISASSFLWFTPRHTALALIIYMR